MNIFMINGGQRSPKLMIRPMSSLRPCLFYETGAQAHWNGTFHVSCGRI